MKGETRNQRKSRRRRETRDERERERNEVVVRECDEVVIRNEFSHLSILVFYYWEPCPLRICGFIYNDPRFSNGTCVHTSGITSQQKNCRNGTWLVTTSHTTYNVKLMSNSWMQVGANDPLNRLKYKLWPKLVFISLFLRTRTHRTYSPGGIGYMECMERFKRLSVLT